MDYDVSNPLAAALVKKFSPLPQPPPLIPATSAPQEGFVTPLLCTSTANTELKDDLVLKKHFFPIIHLFFYGLLAIIFFFLAVSFSPVLETPAVEQAQQQPLAWW